MQISGFLPKLRRWKGSSFSLLALSLATVASSAGCGEPKRELAPLTGKVIYQDKPLRFGSVVIEHKVGQPATAIIQSDGTFEMATFGEGKGAVVGRCRVCVGCYEGQDPAKKARAGQPAVLGKSLIPDRYTSFDTSGLTVEIRPGQNEPVVLNLTE